MVIGFSGASVNIHLFYVFVIFCSWTCCNVSHNMAKRRWYMSRDNSSREICQNDHDLWPECRKDQKKGKTLTQTCLSVQLCWWIFWIIWQESCKAGLHMATTICVFVPPCCVFIPPFFKQFSLVLWNLFSRNTAERWIKVLHRNHSSA